MKRKTTYYVIGSILVLLLAGITAAAHLTAGFYDGGKFLKVHVDSHKSLSGTIVYYCSFFDFDWDIKYAEKIITEYPKSNKVFRQATISEESSFQVPIRYGEKRSFIKFFNQYTQQKLLILALDCNDRHPIVKRVLIPDMRDRKDVTVSLDCN